MQKILVTGATGSNGRQLVVSLLNKGGIDVRAFVRNAEKAADLADAGADVVTGDFDDVEALATAVSGVDTVVLIAPPGPDAPQQNSNVIRAASAAGVRKIVRLSAILAASDGPTDNSRLHAISDAELQESGMVYVILRPNYFMQNAFMSTETISGENLIYAGMGDGRLSMIDVRDVVDSLAQCATSDRADNQILDLGGPESISFHEMADAFSEALGREIRYVPVSPEAVRQSLLDAGFGEWMAGVLRDYSQAYSEGKGDFVNGNVEMLSGHPARSVHRFAQEVFAPAFTQG